MKNTNLANDSLDIAVFCNSLSGENWPDYIAEAARVLRTNGKLMIAASTKSMQKQSQ
jgi:ubiquinone/menaquinone biosynthesis C-methylase UbiE